MRIIMILGICGILMALIAITFQQHSSQLKQETAWLAEEREQMGLPDGYPVEQVPVLEGIEIKSAEQLTATDTKGREMDQWQLEARTELTREQVFDYYSEYLVDNLGLSQTKTISIPSGEHHEYADERWVVQVEYEQLEAEAQPVLRLNVYRARD